MRLYTLTGAGRVDDPTHGSFTADANGAFEFPNELSTVLHGFHIGGKPEWETDAERHNRLAAEELEHLRDPATLLAAIQGLSALAGSQLAPANVPADAQPVAKRTTKRTPASAKADAQG